MQKLTAMTIGALALGFGAFVVDATAQPPERPAGQVDAGCQPREVAIYFARGSNALNEFGQALVKDMAAEARACGAGALTVQAAADPARADAVARALRAAGVEPVIVRSPSLVPVADTLVARSVTLRLAPAAATVG